MSLLCLASLVFLEAAYIGYLASDRVAVIRENKKLRSQIPKDSL